MFGCINFSLEPVKKDPAPGTEAEGAHGRTGSKKQEE